MRIQWTPTLEERRAEIKQRDRRQIQAAKNSSTIGPLPSASGVSTVIDSRSITALLVSECAENQPRIRVERSEYTIVPGTTQAREGGVLASRTNSHMPDVPLPVIMFVSKWRRVCRPARFCWHVCWRVSRSRLAKAARVRIEATVHHAKD